MSVQFIYSYYDRLYHEHLHTGCLFMPDVRIKKPNSENLMKYSRLRREFLKHVRIFSLVTQQWIPGSVSNFAQCSREGGGVCMFRIGVKVIHNLQ